MLEFLKSINALCNNSKTLKIIPYVGELEKFKNKKSFSEELFENHLDYFFLCSFNEEITIFTNSIDIQLLENIKHIESVKLIIEKNQVSNYIESKNAENIIILSDFIYYSSYLDLCKKLNKKLNVFSLEHLQLEKNNFSTHDLSNKELILLEETISLPSWKEKIKNIKDQIIKYEDLDYFFIESKESVSWILNIRTKNENYSPFAMAKLLIDIKNETFYIISDDNNLNFINKENLLTEEEFKLFAKLNFIENKIIGIDYFCSSLKSVEEIKSFGKIQIKDIRDPTIKYKAQKSLTEIKSFKEISLIDSAKIIEFLFYFSKNIGKITEIDCKNKIFLLRQKSDLFICNSFDTISAFKENSAIIHYKCTEESNKLIDANGIYLIDSGGHYIGGTTDITRTLLVGDENEEQTTLYTLVLKGLIAMQGAKFSSLTIFSYLDGLARQFLKEKNFNYPHGTSHGIGNCLNVHEHLDELKTNSSLKQGMIISIEPGVYFDNKFGIRIENDVFVKKIDSESMEFEVLNFVPYDKRMINQSMLSEEEKSHLSKYNREIIEKTERYLDREVFEWLKKELLFL